jgi:hypothetical protein
MTSSDGGAAARGRLYGNLKTQLRWVPDAKATLLNVRQFLETDRGVEIKVLVAGARARARCGRGAGAGAWAAAAAVARPPGLRRAAPARGRISAAGTKPSPFPPPPLASQYKGLINTATGDYRYR